MTRGQGPPDDGQRIGAIRTPSSHFDEDACLDLVHGLLRREEEEPLLAHARACTACQELVRSMAAEREQLRAQAAFMRSKSSARGQVRAGRWVDRWVDWITGAGRIPIPRLALGLGAAAIAIVVISTRLPMGGPSGSDEVRLQWLPEVSGTIVSRDPRSEETDPELVAGLKAYAHHDAAGAIRQLEASRASGRTESLRLVYLGSALAWAGRYDEAAATLHGLDVESLPEPWRSETRWTLAMALRATGRMKGADSLLSTLATTEGDVGERARSLRGSK